MSNISEAERMAMAQLLMGEAEELIQRANPEWFEFKINRGIFEAARRLYNSGRVYVATNIKSEIEPEFIGEYDLNDYMSKLLEDYSPALTNSNGYCDALEDSWRKSIAKQAVKQITDVIEGQGRWHDVAEKAASQIMASIANLDDGANLYDAMMATVEKASNMEGRVFSMGLPKIDEHLGGWVTGEVFALYAPEGVGKSALMLNMALSAFYGGARVLWVGTEEHWIDTTARVFAREADIPVTAFRHGISKKQANKAHEFTAALKDGDRFKFISSIDKPSEILGYVSAETNRKCKPDIVVLDNASFIGKGSPQEQAELVGKLARTLAVNHDVASAVVAHVPKEATKNEPNKHNVFGGTGISRPASKMLELRYSEGHNGFGKVHKIDAYITKNRYGASDICIPLSFIGEQMRFEER